MSDLKVSLKNKSPVLLFFLLTAVGWPQDRVQRVFVQRLIPAAIERTHHQVRYVSDYVRIPYPGGDVPSDTGVCTDEIIRIYRAVGIDLQRQVHHEDMVHHFNDYPLMITRTKGNASLIPISIIGEFQT